MRLTKRCTGQKQPTDMPFLIFDFHVAATVDFFAAMYFLIARRLFCLLRLCQFFRASCFTLVLLVRGLFADRSSVRRTFSHPRLSFQSRYFFPLQRSANDRSETVSKLSAKCKKL